MQKQELNSQSLHFQTTVLSLELQCRLWPAVLALLHLWNPLCPEARLPLMARFPMEVARLGYSADTVFFLGCSTNECFHEHPWITNNKPSQTLPTIPESPTLDFVVIIILPNHLALNDDQSWRTQSCYQMHSDKLSSVKEPPQKKGPAVPNHPAHLGTWQNGEHWVVPRETVVMEKICQTCPNQMRWLGPATSLSWVSLTAAGSRAQQTGQHPTSGAGQARTGPSLMSASERGAYGLGAQTPEKGAKWTHVSKGLLRWTQGLSNFSCSFKNMATIAFHHSA